MPAIAKTSTNICPDLVKPQHYGAHSSRVLIAGVREWTFASEKARDRFLKVVSGGAFRRPKKEKI
jgi:hypothetical protein